MLIEECIEEEENRKEYELSEDDLLCIGMQMKQHIQLLTQMTVLTSSQPGKSGINLCRSSIEHILSYPQSCTPPTATASG